MGKRVVSFVLVFSMMLSLLAFSAAAEGEERSGTCGENVTWTLSSNGVLTISGSGEMYDYANSCTNPSPFYSLRTKIKQVRIENGVTAIGKRCFLCCRLESVSLPDSLLEIRSRAFESCSDLAEVTIPASVKEIGQQAFYHCSKLRQFQVSPQNRSFAAGDGILYSYDYATLMCCPNLDKQSFSIPDSVTEIAPYALSDYENLHSLFISEHVEKIGVRAFPSSKNLSISLPPQQEHFKLVDKVLYTQDMKELLWCSPDNFGVCSVPDGVEVIREAAFYYCGGLSRISLPSTLREIGQEAFEYCSGLTEMIIPGSVRSILHWTFAECINLKYITLPASVTYVVRNAFYNCYSLKDIYYAGSHSRLLLTSEGCYDMSGIEIHYNQTGPALPTGVMAPRAPLVDSDGTFHFYSDHLKDETGKITLNGTYEYDETWFTRDSSEYQHDLAKMSVRAAIAAFGLSDDTSEANYANIQMLMKALRFENPQFYYPKPEADSIGYAISSKNIRDADGHMFSLLMVAVRGGGYYDEWGGNVNVGSSGYHRGFYIAAQKVVDGVDAYIKKYGSDLLPDKKVWISGYSRAAATTNIAAAKLNVKFGMDNVYAYCFECPQGVTAKDADSERYSNIHCIVNPIDFVPKVAMNAWNFTRYGNTYFLPARGSNSDYKALKSRMAASYETLLKNNGVKNTAEMLQKLTSEVVPRKGNEGSVQQYVFDRMAYNAAMALSSRLSYAAIHQKQFVAAVTDIMGNKEHEIGAAALDGMAVSFMLSYIAKQNTIWGALLLMDLPSLCKYIGYAHYPELCLSWLDALDGDQMVKWQQMSYRTVFINCPVDVSVYDADNRLVAQIINDEPQPVEDGVGAYLDENGQKVLILPMDMDYTVSVTATDAGDVTYTVSDYDLASSSVADVVSYQNISVKKGDTLSGAVPKKEDSAVYTLKAADGTMLKPDVDQHGSDAGFCAISVTATSGGTATPGGYFVSGEYAGLTATPDEGCSFLGWYQDDTLLSAEPTWRFMVTGSAALEARFRDPNAPESPAPGAEPVLPTPVTSLKPHVSGNVQYNSYHEAHYPNFNSRWSYPVWSDLHERNGGLERVEYVPLNRGFSLIWEQYRMDGVLLEQGEIPMELPIFGGFYAGADENYIVFGQNNPDQDDDAEVLRVVRYSKDWERLDSVSIKGINTESPIFGGPLRMTEDDDLLYVHTCHKMYNGHQSNLTFALQKTDLRVTDMRCEVSAFRTGYVSHSFNQFILNDNGRIVTLDQGDAYPRSAVLHRYPYASINGTFIPSEINTGASTENVDIMLFQGAYAKYGNATGASLGGLAATDTHYIVAGMAIDTDGMEKDLDYGQRNVFVASVPKDNLNEDAVELTWLTNYAPGEKQLVFTPQLLSLSDGRCFVMWDDGVNTNYTFLNAAGEPDGKVYSRADAAVSDCPPVEINGKIYWYVTFCFTLHLRSYYLNEQEYYFNQEDGLEAPTIYCLDPKNPGDLQIIKTGLINTPTSTPTPSAPTPTPSAPTPTPSAPTPTPSTPTPTPSTPTPTPSTPTPTPVVSNPFRDVAAGQYYYDPVLWAVKHVPQITNGTSATTFSPDNTCTRGQVVTFLWRAMGCPEPKSTRNPFTDVKTNDYFYKAVLWAAEKNITNGTSANTFSPGNPCTRAHVVTFLWRAHETPAAGKANPFGDVPSGQYYTDAVLWAVSREITNGTSATTFSPDKPCTRGQIVTFLYRDMK